MGAAEGLLEVSGPAAVAGCLGLAAWFVGSLYIWPDTHRVDRNSPYVVKRRFMSVGLVCVTAVLLLATFAHVPLLSFDPPFHQFIYQQTVVVSFRSIDYSRFPILK